MVKLSGFYVTVIRGKRVGYVLGPFITHAAALARVETGRTLGAAADPRSVFDVWGTTKVTAAALPDGVLNDRAGLVRGDLFGPLCG